MNNSYLYAYYLQNQTDIDILIDFRAAVLNLHITDESDFWDFIAWHAALASTGRAV